MKNALMTGSVIVFALLQGSLAKADTMIGFFCESQGGPTYAFPVDPRGSVQPVSSGNFGHQVRVNELPFRNGDVRTQLSPFHPYCSVVIEYVNKTNNPYSNRPGLNFSTTATLATSCEGGPVKYKECRIAVKW